MLQQDNADHTTDDLACGRERLAVAGHHRATTTVANLGPAFDMSGSLGQLTTVTPSSASGFTKFRATYAPSNITRTLPRSPVPSERPWRCEPSPKPIHVSFEIPSHTAVLRGDVDAANVEARRHRQSDHAEQQMVHQHGKANPAVAIQPGAVSRSRCGMVMAVRRPPASIAPESTMDKRNADRTSRSAAIEATATAMAPVNGTLASFVGTRCELPRLSRFRLSCRDDLDFSQCRACGGLRGRLRLAILGLLGIGVVSEPPISTGAIFVARSIRHDG